LLEFQPIPRIDAAFRGWLLRNRFINYVNRTRSWRQNQIKIAWYQEKYSKKVKILIETLSKNTKRGVFWLKKQIGITSMNMGIIAQSTVNP